MSKAEEIKHQRVQSLLEDEHLSFITFKGASYYRNSKQGEATRGYTPTTADDFAKLVYRRYGGISKNAIADIQHQLELTAPDVTEEAGHLIQFGQETWDMRTLSIRDDFPPYVVYSTHIKLQPLQSSAADAARSFLDQLACGDKDLAFDYLQALAPLFMAKRPVGVIWFVGNGANGKSSLISAIYRGFAPYLQSITPAAMEDSRDTPSLVGKLGNIVDESSEARVEDDQVYKAIGSHASFTVHEFHKQGGKVIKADFHTVLNANNIPVFADKSDGARRRTLVIPFRAHFQDDPTFEDRTFTDEFLGGLYALILDAAKQMGANGHVYKWSDTTIKVKQAYDSDVNSAEAYISDLIERGVQGFINYGILRGNYERWCDENGKIALGKLSLTRVVENMASPESRVITVDGRAARRRIFARAPKDLVWLDDGYAYCMPDAERIKQLTLGTQETSDEW